jgi:uncharacterized protein YndB with AHSA1/START domain
MNNTTFTTSVRIEASPDEVFPYLVDADLITRWMGEYAKFDVTVGGVYALDINGHPLRGEFLELDPPQRLVFSWGFAGNEVTPPGSTVVEITLVADGEATVLELSHRDLPEEDGPRAAVGWHHFLPRLVIAAGGGDPGPDPWATG